MVFSSNVFLMFFLPVSLIVYYIIEKFSKKSLVIANIWLIAVSLFFYAWGEPLYVFVMIGSIIVNFVIGKLLLRFENPGPKKLLLALACAVNLGILFVFKYLQWIIGKDLKIALPIGISFYTFQALSYVIDVYRGGYDRKETGFVNVCLYISFFPQLIAGPIVRFSTVSEQIRSRTHSFEKVSEGVWRFVQGLAKKVLLANQIAPFVDLAFKADVNPTVVMAWVGALASILQIYFDFSGYSDMAIGLGKMFGFEFEENFNYPFMARSISEYWRRWHISLGQWFRDYLFYPLSLGPALRIRKKLTGKVSSKTAAFISSAFVLFIVWLSTGIWHGANMTFVVWGLLQFVIILFEQNRKPVKGLCHIKTVLIFILGGVIFKASNLSQAFAYIKCLLGLGKNGFADGPSIYWIGQYGVLILLGVLFSFPVVPAMNRIMAKNRVTEGAWDILKTVALLCFLAVSVSYTIGSGYNPFIYFNF